MMLRNFKKVDATSKTGVYCEAALIEVAVKTGAWCFWWIIKNIQPISVGV